MSMSVLERLADYSEGRIVSFELSADKTTVEVREECDGYFSVTLGKASFGQMIAELQAMHSQMVDSPTIEVRKG